MAEQFANNDDLKAQPSYRFRVTDEKGLSVPASVFSGVPTVYDFRLPPQSIQIQRNIRADVVKDLNRGVSIVSGGEGVGRISIDGTHGVGAYKGDIPSAGLQFRDGLVAFFDAFIKANDERSKIGSQGLRLIYEMVGGHFSNPTFEQYLVWPENYPRDSRHASRPHSWDWSISLLILGALTPKKSVDPATVDSPAVLVEKADGVLGSLSLVSKFWTGLKSVVRFVRDLKNKILQIRNRIQAFATGVRDFVYTVTDLVRGSAQLCQDILRAIDVTDILNDSSIAIRGAIYECRRFLGSCGITAQQFKRSGVVQETLTAPRTTSLSRPVIVPIAPGDTLQSIAARTLGSFARWPELVKANALVFPYLDFSGPNGSPGSAYSGKNVMGSASLLKIPLPATPGVGVADDPIGTDIPEDPATAGILIGGQENLLAAIMRRFNTPVGHIPWHPGYGSALPSMVGDVQSVADVASIRAEAKNNLLSEPRVLDVLSVSVEADGAVVTFDAEVLTPLGPLQVSGALS